MAIRRNILIDTQDSNDIYVENFLPFFQSIDLANNVGEVTMDSGSYDISPVISDAIQTIGNSTIANSDTTIQITNIRTKNLPFVSSRTSRISIGDKITYQLEHYARLYALKGLLQSDSVVANFTSFKSSSSASLGSYYTGIPSADILTDQAPFQEITANIMNWEYARVNTGSDSSRFVYFGTPERMSEFNINHNSSSVYYGDGIVNRIHSIRHGLSDNKVNYCISSKSIVYSNDTILDTSIDIPSGYIHSLLLLEANSPNIAFGIGNPSVVYNEPNNVIYGTIQCISISRNKSNVGVLILHS